MKKNTRFLNAALVLIQPYLNTILSDMSVRDQREEEIVTTALWKKHQITTKSVCRWRNV